MPLIIADLVEQQSKKDEKKEEDKTQQNKDESTESKETEGTSTSKSEPKKFDGRTAPGMEGMSEEAIKRFEEAMEIEYQKREGGA